MITQPAHAALSAQLAHGWGNDRFGEVEPRDAVSLGALLHDIGWLDWEQSPTLNPSTGLPHSFMQLPTRVHLDIWESASRRALTFGRYPALLTSLHFTGLYDRFHDYSRDSEADARDARALVDRERAFQNDLVGALRSDSTMADAAGEAQLNRNRQLVALWDGMSLAICHGIGGPREFRNVPSSDGEMNITLSMRNADVVVDPWPFQDDRVDVTADGRVLTRRFDDQVVMQEALAHASWIHADDASRSRLTISA